MVRVESRIGQWRVWLKSKAAALFGVRLTDQQKLRNDLLRKAQLFSRPLDPKSRMHATNTLKGIALLKDVRQILSAVRPIPSVTPTCPRAFGELLRSPNFLNGVLTYPNAGTRPCGVDYTTVHADYLSLIEFACEQGLLSAGEALDLLLGSAGKVPGTAVDSYMYFLLDHPNLPDNVTQQYGKALRAAFEASLRSGLPHTEGRLQRMQALLSEKGYGTSGGWNVYEALCEFADLGEGASMRVEALVIAELIPDKATLESVLPKNEAHCLSEKLYDNMVRPRLGSSSKSSISLTSDTLSGGARSRTGSPGAATASFESILVPLVLEQQRRTTPPGMPILRPLARDAGKLATARRASSDSSLRYLQPLPRSVSGTNRTLSLPEQSNVAREEGHYDLPEDFFGDPGPTGIRTPSSGSSLQIRQDDCSPRLLNSRRSVTRSDAGGSSLIMQTRHDSGESSRRRLPELPVKPASIAASRVPSPIDHSLSRVMSPLSLVVDQEKGIEKNGSSDELPSPPEWMHAADGSPLASGDVMSIVGDAAGDTCPQESTDDVFLADSASERFFRDVVPAWSATPRATVDIGAKVEPVENPPENSKSGRDLNAVLAERAEKFRLSSSASVEPGRSERDDWSD